MWLWFGAVHIFYSNPLCVLTAFTSEILLDSVHGVWVWLGGVHVYNNIPGTDSLSKGLQQCKYI